jgi:ribosomal protein S18 acetylase RimI-like enzyme
MVSIKEKSLVSFEKVSAEMLTNLHEVSTLAYFQSYFGPYTYQQLKPYLEEFFSEEILKREMSKSEIDYFLVKLSGKCIGFSLVKRGMAIENGNRTSLPNSAELNKLYLLQKYTGKGFGTQFMKMMSSYYASRNIVNLYATTWALNPRALRFYKRQGFQVMGEIEYEFAGQSNIDLVLKKDLTLSSDQML